MSAHMQSDIDFRGSSVTLIWRDVRGRFVRRQTFHNAAKDHMRKAVAKWLVGINNTGYNPAKPPNAIALGNGSGTVTFSEVASTRKTCTARVVYNDYYAQFTTVWRDSDPNGTFTQAALMDDDGNIFAIVELANVSKAAGQTLTGVWKVLVQGS